MEFTNVERCKKRKVLVNSGFLNLFNISLALLAQLKSSLAQV